MNNLSKNNWMSVIGMSVLFFIAMNAYAMDKEVTPILLVHEIKHDTSLPLSEVHTLFAGTYHPTIMPFHHLPGMSQGFLQKQDSVAQLFQGSALNIQPVINFIGLGGGLGGYVPFFTPPDTTGAPGLTQYVQIVNSSLAIFNKINGTLEYGPVNTNTLWAGFGGVCETTNQGDALVKYDQLANRWVISQFAFNTSGDQKFPPFFQCVAVSTTSDARSAYHRYAFAFSNFNDYGKLGLAPTAYFMSFFMFNAAGDFIGPMACALPRNNMINGQAAVMQCFNPSQQNTSIDLIPADLDGITLPPPHTPEFFLSLNKLNHVLSLWKFDVNWTNPNASTFKGPIPIAGVAPFVLPSTDTGSRDPDQQTQGAIPQPNTSVKLDILDDRLMYRLAYRQFPTYGTLLVNHSVAGVSAVAGVRWYQINILNSGSYIPNLVQQGTFTPDATSRWMGSIAIDKNKNIALGYSVSSASVFPSIAITGRAPQDPKGVMRNEMQLAAGRGSQTGDYRWGDYSTMSVDPVDDCTFWYTTEYLQLSSPSAGWSTRVVAFRYPNCV